MSTSAAYRELGATLRGLRENAGLTLTELANRLGLPLTTLSRMETGHRASTTTDVIQHVVGCGLSYRKAQELFEFTRMAERQQGYYLSDQGIGGSLQSLIFHESMADYTVGYEAQMVHGLLQTPEYARAMISSVDADSTPDQLDGAVRTRMERSRILAVPEPAWFTFYIHEQALRLQVGTAKVMHEQLLHLVFTAARENVSIRVVPSAAGERSVLGAFRLMEFALHKPIVYLDNLANGGLIIDEPAYVRGYYELIPKLEGIALDEEQSREFAAGLADEYDRGSHWDGADTMAQEQLQWRIGNGLRGGGVVS
ncbi:helix-turn-helix domain-containing protein [Actinokineospora diospyrosa]|uniref:Helix-turn-helix domain-containing protein n=1 Tax=Actinokineospora diospyrosa TaxID=103728 RepID=A0ABT1IMH0_9PSEU|nr:helix-turn-helix transcriptional regulator [Actinokineospora diospyrosa]MCP2273869.1 Helix-turn-helix domain-containing protein [Actinokineospora diospyrosa]